MGAWLLVQLRLCQSRSCPLFGWKRFEPTGAEDAFTAAIIARSLATTWAPLSVEDVRYAAARGGAGDDAQGHGMGCRIERSSTRSLLVSEFLSDRWCD